jgi:hypothetical protein
MRKSRFLLLFLVVALFSAPALAQKVIHFANGTSLPIKDFVIEDSMIHVDLGGDGYIAFPAEMIDRVEEAGIAVPFMPSNVADEVVRQVPDPTRDYPVSGRRTPRASGTARSSGAHANGGVSPQAYGVGAAGAENPHGHAASRGTGAITPNAKGITPRGTQWVTGGRSIPGRGARARPEVISLQPNPRLGISVPRPVSTIQPIDRSSEGENR